MHEFVESARRETGDSTVVSFLTATLIVPRPRCSPSRPRSR